MAEIMEDLNLIDGRFSDENFLSNKGMSNEVGIHVFCYEPKDEAIVQAFFEKLQRDEKDKPYHIIECDLYKIFLQICEEKHIINGIPKMEDTKGKDFLMKQLEKVATPEAFVEKMKYDSHQYGDILLISGVGKVYPFMRSHKILDNIQHIFSDIPVVMLYPGKFNGQALDLFGKFLDGNYYRAFNLL